jgi:hypothetical protein
VTAWFKGLEIFDKHGAKVGVQPVDLLCRPCGIGIESNMTEPFTNEDEIDKFFRSFVASLKQDRGKKGMFLAATAYLGESPPERTWPKSDVKSRMITGVRSILPAQFVPEAVVDVDLGVKPSELKDVRVVEVINEHFKKECGIVVPVDGIPAGILPKTRRVEVFSETLVEVVETVLGHKETLRDSHAINRGELLAKVLHMNRPGVLSTTDMKAVTHSWADIAAMANKIQAARAAQTASREAARNGGAVAPQVVSASTLSSRSMSMLSSSAVASSQQGTPRPAPSRRAGSVCSSKVALMPPPSLPPDALHIPGTSRASSSALPSLVAGLGPAQSAPCSSAGSVCGDAISASAAATSRVVPGTAEDSSTVIPVKTQL